MIDHHMSEETNNAVTVRPKIDEFLDFLSEWKTRKEIMNHFKLSNTQSFRMLLWLKRGNFIRQIEFKREGKKQKEFMYRKL